MTNNLGLNQILREYSTDFHSPVHQTMNTLPLSVEQFPVPELVLFVLRNMFGCKWQDVGEKVRWSILCSFREEPIIFDLKKFGLTLTYPVDMENSIETALGRLCKAIKFAEKELDKIADQQINDGNVSIANYYHDFYRRYRFFRDQASISYNKEAPVDTEFGLSTQPDRPHIEGGYMTIAMIDAYFSYLEHILALMLPFCGFDFKSGEIKKLISGTWSDKFKFVCKLSDPECKVIYDDLLKLKKVVRNPMAHGGVENKWNSLYIHMPDIGELPACFSAIKESIRFDFVPFNPAKHNDVCDVFDKTDELLSSGNRYFGFRYAKSGMNVAFNPDWVSHYNEAMTSKQNFEEFIEYVCKLSDDYDNVDF